ncbi:MAG: HAMP domain-containing protein [Acidobacteria bacterium]|nr:HAMP domain-containing protein [Acidobacteriota bacterium]
MAQPLRRQIFTVILILTLVVYAAIGYGAYLTYSEHVRQLAAETSTMAATVVVYVNRNLEAADAVAATASRHPSMRALDPRATAEVLLPLVGGRDQLLNNALMADTTGQVQAWAQPPEAKVEGLLDPAWLKSVADTGQTKVSPMLGGPGDSAHSIVLGYPITSLDNKVVGVIGLAVHLEALERILRSIPLPAGSVVTLTDHNSVVVARSLDSALYVGRPITARANVLEPEDVPSTVIRTGVDGIERVFGNAVVDRGPWLASVGIPTSVARGRTAPIYRRNFAISVFLTILIFGVTFIFGRRWIKPFDHLDETARRVSRGDLSPLEPHPMPTAEMEHLQQTVRGMITNLQSAREAIAAQVDDERRMREELQSLQQQVIRQERLAAIGVLVSGVAHELNNPLQAILGFSELLQMQKEMPESARADLTLIQKESTRARAIIRNLSRFGRQMSEPTPVKLHDVVASVMELRHRKLEELNIRVEVDEKSVAPVMAIFTELQQVLLNFAINAEQAIVHSDSETRRIVIRTGDRDGWAWIEVEDSGPGVPPQDEAKLFQPFHTTKQVGEGTGLGLSVSYDIIRTYGGRIGYRPATAGGAVFFFELPIVPAD